MDKKELLKEQIDKIVAEILRDVSGVDALRYYTEKILAKASACYEAMIREIFEEIEKHSATEKLPYRDGGDTICTIPEESYQALKSKYLGGTKSNEREEEDWLGKPGPSNVSTLLMCPVVLIVK